MRPGEKEVKRPVRFLCELRLHRQALPHGQPGDIPTFSSWFQGSASELLSRFLRCDKQRREMNQVSLDGKGQGTTRLDMKFRGFAVVADEVRTLASRTQQSTEEIQEMIKRLQNSSSEAGCVIDAGGKLAHTSVSSVQQANESLRVINNRIENINQMNTQVATAAEEQCQVSLELDKNITNIAMVAEDNAQSVALLNSTGVKLNSNLQQLDLLMKQFKI